MKPYKITIHFDSVEECKWLVLVILTFEPFDETQ